MIKRAAPTPSAGASGLWAMTYSPYQNSGGCKGASEVDADIAKIAGLGFTAVRIYSTDCSGLQNVGDAAKAHGIKLILGIYIDATGIEASKGQVQAIQAWAQWDLVEMIVVGNEAVFNGFCSAGDLASYISYCKSAFSGYSGPITTSEPLNILQENTSTICAVVDVVGCNVHPYFNSATTADQAGSFASSELDLLKGLCPGKTAYILETGWPNAGSANGAAVPGIAEQQTAITGIKGTVGTVATFFSFVDDGWKQPGPLGVENHWGCSSVFGG
ncbi:MAG: hypothetical protein M1824_006594 [Vezdaea acicularis]|nr:MAG: hypothetical protein M1824_006594 [Vezdaea acicularis]